jgi:hypothetical protein
MNYYLCRKIHERQLTSSRNRNEPAGQIARREVKLVHFGNALRRADELDNDFAAAIEVAADGLSS